MSRSVTAALFDVDGTLVDSNYLHAVTWWQAFARFADRPLAAHMHGHRDHRGGAVRVPRAG
jgi:beta-phosphoglucomutase-like phosphatase (HAD superfamily)